MASTNVLAIAEHERLPEVAAAAMAQYLVDKQIGPVKKIRDMSIDDVRQSQTRGDTEHVQALLHVLHHFLMAYPEACSGGAGRPSS